MDDLYPNDLLVKSPVAGNRPGADCPDDQILAAALDGEYRLIERSAFEAHVSDCSYCLARLGRIARLQRGETSAETFDVAVARAQRLIRSRPATPRVPAWAAAAMIGFAAILTTLWFTRVPESSGPARIAAPEVRNIDPDAYRPQVLVPGEGALIDVHNSLFEWSAVPGTLHYDVRIVSADGTLIWQQRVQKPEWRVPESLRLAAGEDYYFRVDAYLTRAKSLSSRHVMFRVRKDE